MDAATETRHPTCRLVTENSRQKGDRLVINLTEAAAGQLQKLLEEKGMTDHGLRVFVSGGGCSGLQYGMTFAESPIEGDQVFEDQNIKLIVDSGSLMYLMGAEIDYVEENQGVLTGYEIKWRKGNFRVPKSWTDTYKADVKLLYQENYLDFIPQNIISYN